MRSILRRSLPLKSNSHLTLPSQYEFSLCLCEEHWPSLQCHLACFSTLFQKDLRSRQVIVVMSAEANKMFVVRHLYDHFLPRKPVSDFRWMYNDCEQQLIDATGEGKNVLKDGALFLTNPCSTTYTTYFWKKVMQKKITFNPPLTRNVNFSHRKFTKDVFFHSKASTQWCRMQGSQDVIFKVELLWSMRYWHKQQDAT